MLDNSTYHFSFEKSPAYCKFLYGLELGIAKSLEDILHSGQCLKSTEVMLGLTSMVMTQSRITLEGKEIQYLVCLKYLTEGPVRKVVGISSFYTSAMSCNI